MKEAVTTASDKTVMEIEDDEVAETTRDCFQQSSEVIAEIKVGVKRLASQAIDAALGGEASKRPNIAQ